MALIDRIRACDNADLSSYRPFRVGDVRIGWIGPAVAEALDAMPGLALRRDQSGTGFVLDPALRDPAARGRAMADVVATLDAAGLLSAKRGELYAARRRWADPPLFLIERAATPALGLRAWGVHLVGYMRRPDGYWFWIGTRSRAKPTYPGQLDNMVAGGQPAELSFRDNLIKECAEEADMDAALAGRAVPVGMLSYAHEDAPGRGVKPDQIMLYDLAVPEDFVPVNRDGELEGFALLHQDAVLALIRDTERFKFNCSVVLIHFFLRHGLIDPDLEPDYAALAAGLTIGEGRG